MKALNKAFLFTAALILTHVLKIKPSTFDIGGLQIAIDDIIVLQGIIAIGVLNYFYIHSDYSNIAQTFVRFQPFGRVERAALIKAMWSRGKGAKAKPLADIKVAAKFYIWVWRFKTAAYGLILIPLMYTGIGLALYDAVRFGVYLVKSL